MAVQHKWKILLLGDGAVGKTSLIRRYVTDQFSDDYIATIGTKVTKRDVAIHRGTVEVSVSLMIWDVLGQREYTRVQEGAFSGAKGALLVYDVTRPETYENLKKFWIRRLWTVVGKVPVAVLGNKCDLLASREAAVQDLRRLAGSIESPGWLASARTGENVELAFLSLAGMILRGEERMEDEAPRRVALQLGVPVDPYAAAAVADKIMMDFCNTFGGVDAGMPVVRQVFALAGMDIRNPSVAALRKAVDSLAEVEEGFLAKDAVAANRARRLEWVADIRA